MERKDGKLDGNDSNKPLCPLVFIPHATTVQYRWPSCRGVRRRGVSMNPAVFAIQGGTDNIEAFCARLCQQRPQNLVPVGSHVGAAAD